MSEPTGCAAACCRSTYPDLACGYRVNRDLLVGLPGLHVVAVGRVQSHHYRDGEGLLVTVESPPGVMGCPRCGVIAHSHGRRAVDLVDAPCFGRPVMVRWRKRTWTCPDTTCPVGTFTEQNPQVASARALLTTRATRWAIEALRREQASIQGLARQLGTTWRTVWRSIRPLLESARRGRVPVRRGRRPRGRRPRGR